MKLTSQINLFSTVSSEDKIFFTRYLAIMIRSGIPISEAIELIGKQTKNEYFKGILDSVYKSILNGQSLEKSLSRFPSIFNSFYIYMVRVGEESGTLEKNLQHLAIQLKKDDEFRKKVTAASLYPGIVIVTAMVIGGGISLFVLPKLITLFDSMDVKLPLSTQILLFIATTMRDYGIYIFSGLALLGIIFRFLLTLPKIKIVWEKFWFSMPAIGKFLQNIQVSQFTRNLGVMIQSGLPISQAIDTQKLATSNLVYHEYIIQIQKGIEKGKDITSTIDSKKFKYFPEIATRMIEVGEKTGKLDEALLYLGDFFEEEIDNDAKNLTTILEPILLVVVGLVVAFIALAIITPIYQFTGSIKR